MVPNQHLPERQYPCKDCRTVFDTPKAFSDHFEREGFVIVGCKDSAPALPFPKAQRPVERPA
jgi:hypothetical protein